MISLQRENYSRKEGTCQALFAKIMRFAKKEGVEERFFEAFKPESEPHAGRKKCSRHT